MNSSHYRRYSKRCLDVVIAAAALVALSPILAAVALLVRVKLGCPVLFRQQRPGRDGKLFELIKFRSMSQGRDARGRPLPDEFRLTRFGRFLRSSSLDELPQLWNVLRGEMSLVGPRPCLPEYMDLYTEEQSRRHAMRPGMTGWAQVNGRNGVSWQDRLQRDVWYVDRCSLGLDLRILAMTVSTVVRRSGVSAEGHATMPAFTGTAGEAREEREILLMPDVAGRQRDRAA